MLFKQTIKRRQLLALGALAFSKSVFALNSVPISHHASEQLLYLSAASDSNDQHWVSGFTLHDGTAKTHFKHALPGRAHHIAAHQKAGLFVVVARRPGRYLLVGDVTSGEILANIEVPEDRHLVGHGVFSGDGQYFYAPESDYQDTQGDSGRIVVWSVLNKTGNNGRTINFERINDFPSFGVGPHELLLMPDNKTLVVANGGIRTHPDSGREKLNIETMQPSLVYLDAATGELLEQRRLANEFHQASIRHLDVNAAGKVVMAMQYEGEPFDAVPLLATHQRGQALVTLNMPDSVRQEMRQYVGSTRFDSSGRFVAASCPRGNIITLWDTESGEFVEKLRSRDGCGVCAMGDGFLFTAGTGRIIFYSFGSGRVEKILAEKNQKIFWDNHLTQVDLV